MKKILIINGHPDKESFCTSLVESYRKGVEDAAAQCKVLTLIDMDFEPILKFGYRKRTDLEPDLLLAQEYILEADHLVWVYPNWWGTYPALMKGFIDRVFLPTFSFRYRENSLLWDKLLKGKTARLIVTMDTPAWYYALVYKNAGHHAMKVGLLEFCGVKPVKITAFTPVKTADEAKRTKWLAKVEKLGQQLK